MTTFAADRIALRSPDALLAALPYLLGFHPSESAVLVWLRSGRIALTQRLDLPPCAEALPAWSAAVWAHHAADISDHVVLVVVSAAEADPAVVAAVVDVAEERGVGMRDVLRLHDGRWWSLLCSDPDCCPADGRPIDAGARAAVGAEFTYQGRVPLADRGDLVEQFASDAAAAVGVAEHLVSARVRRGGIERWRDRRLRRIESLLASDAPLDDVALAEVLTGLADVRVRDTVLWEAGRWSADAVAHALERIAAAVRAAPPGTAAPVATVAGLLAWMCGDGARALTCLERATADDADYSLALLLSAALHAGMSPDAWREGMQVLTRADCRYGMGAPG